MKKLLLTSLLCLGLASPAFAADPPVEPKKSCCEKMKESGKDCCPEKADAAHGGHADHAMDAPKG